MLIRQPLNKRDAGDIGVHNLSGKLLGFVPRYEEDKFKVCAAVKLLSLQRMSHSIMKLLL